MSKTEHNWNTFMENVGFRTYTPVIVDDTTEIDMPVFGKQSLNNGIDFINGDFIARDLTGITDSQKQVKEQISSKNIFNSPEEDNSSIDHTTKQSNILQNNQKDTALYIMNSLITKGKKTPHEAAGIVGNLMAESNLNPNAFNKNDLGSQSGGIAQWNGINFSKLKEHANSKGKQWNDLDLQIDFLLSSIDNNVKDKLSKSTNPHEASEAWAYYERYAGYDGSTRSAQKLKKSNNWTEQQTLDYIKGEHKKRSDYADEIYKLWRAQA